MLFLSVTKVKLVRVPYQWLLRAEHPQGPQKKVRHRNEEEHEDGTQGGGTPRQDGRQHGKQDNPWETDETQQKTKAKKSGAGGINNNGPPVFTQSTELNKDLLGKHPTVSLRMVAAAAGFLHTTALLLPDNRFTHRNKLFVVHLLRKKMLLPQV
jgi:hypothetical protein